MGRAKQGIAASLSVATRRQNEIVHASPLSTSKKGVDPFAAVFGDTRGSDRSAQLQRLAAELPQLIADWNANDDLLPLQNELAAYADYPEHPATRQLADIVAKDLTEDVWRSWSQATNSPLQSGLAALSGCDKPTSSPWLIAEQHRASAISNRTVHLLDLRPQHSHWEEKTFCGRRRRPQMAEAHLVCKRGDWRAPSRIRAERCAVCEENAPSSQMSIPVLAEQAKDIKKQQSARASQPQMENDVQPIVLRADFVGAAEQLEMHSRQQVLVALEQHVRRDPLPCLRAACISQADHYQVKAAFQDASPSEIEQRLQDLPWAQLCENYLLPTAQAQREQHTEQLVAWRENLLAAL